MIAPPWQLSTLAFLLLACVDATTPHVLPTQHYTSLATKRDRRDSCL
eukprot:SAG11_NODE_16021_length_559_cov_0.797826_1_plen_46_part_10